MGNHYFDLRVSYDEIRKISDDGQGLIFDIDTSDISGYVAVIVGEKLLGFHPWYVRTPLFGMTSRVSLVALLPPLPPQTPVTLFATRLRSRSGFLERYVGTSVHGRAYLSQLGL